MSEQEHEEDAALERAPVRILPELERSLAALKGEATDQATRALAIRYAELLDDAAVADKYAKALRLVGDAVSSYADDLPITAGDQMRTAWDRISSALAEHSVASDLGPKLLAALTALGMTPASRAEKRGSTTGGQKPNNVTPMASPLQLLQGAAQRRNRGA